MSPPLLIIYVSNVALKVTVGSMAAFSQVTPFWALKRKMHLPPSIDFFHRFQAMDSSLTGRGAKPVYRDKVTGENYFQVGI